MNSKNLTFPFTAIVGQDKMKLALILAVIYPHIGGVLLRGERGTGKSLAVRGLVNVLPKIKRIKSCIFGCNPDDPTEMCEKCLKQSKKGEKFETEYKKVRLVELPIGATEERVVGSIDIEEAIKSGHKKFEPGLLAWAHRGILYVDEINLLPDHLVDLLLDSAAMGVNKVEREGISFSHPARFTLVGTMNPEEGELRPQLLDRFGLCVDIKGISNIDERIEIIKRRIEFEKDADSFIGKWKKEEERVKYRIERAKDLLKDIKIDKELLHLVSSLSLLMSVEGHRADLVIVRAAMAKAAFEERNFVTKRDIIEIAPFVFAHRIINPLSSEDTKRNVEEVLKKLEKSNYIEEPKDTKYNNPKPSSGKDMSEIKWISYPVGDPTVFKGFPLKRSKRKTITSFLGRKRQVITQGERGFYVTNRIPKGKIRELSIDATLRFAAPFQKKRGRLNGPLILKKSDLREKVKEIKASNSIVFVVDGSGSMGIKNQMIQTKAAILAMLNDSYQKRDRVGMVVFRGEKAETVLPLTSSVTLAIKKLRDIPTGGKTPLALGLKKGLELLLIERNKNPNFHPLMVVISDGKANSPTGVDPIQMAEDIASMIKKEKISSIFVDTEENHLSFGYARELARAMDGKYVHISNLTTDRLLEVLSG